MPRDDQPQQAGAEPTRPSQRYGTGEEAQHRSAAKRSPRHEKKAGRISIKENEKAVAPILADLRRVGFEVKHLSDFVNYNIDYRGAIPILLDWLPRTENADIKSALVRALTVKAAKPMAGEILIDEFLRATDPTGTGLKWIIANALETVADDSVFDELVDLAHDKKHGKAREMVVMALGNMRNPRVADVLIDLLDDEDVAGHAVVALGRLKSEKATPYLERFLDHPRAWIRKEAKRAVTKIEKAKQAK